MARMLRDNRATTGRDSLRGKRHVAAHPRSPACRNSDIRPGHPRCTPIEGDLDAARPPHPCRADLHRRALRGPGSDRRGGAPQPSAQAVFHRLATYPVYLNRPADVPAADPTVAEISAVSEDGRTFIHTDALAGRIGFVDLTDPAKPRGLGTLDLAADLGVGDHAEPTSVAVVGGYVLVVVDTSESFTNPSGLLAVVDLATHALVRTIDLGGQPDSIALTPDKTHAAIAIENQRDEDVTPAGGDEGRSAAAARRVPAARGPARHRPRDLDHPGRAVHGGGARRARHPAGPRAGVRRDRPDRDHRRGDPAGEQRRRARRHRLRDRARACSARGASR